MQMCAKHSVAWWTYAHLDVESRIAYFVGCSEHLPSGTFECQVAWRAEDLFHWGIPAPQWNSNEEDSHTNGPLEREVIVDSILILELWIHSSVHVAGIRALGHQMLMIALSSQSSSNMKVLSLITRQMHDHYSPTSHVSSKPHIGAGQVSLVQWAHS